MLDEAGGAGCLWYHCCSSSHGLHLLLLLSWSWELGVGYGGRLRERRGEREVEEEKLLSTLGAFVDTPSGTVQSEG